MSSPDAGTGAPATPQPQPQPPAQTPAADATRGLCQRCGFPVPRRLMGCKNPCRNCGTVYPFGDCSD